jgi:glycosyltransferase involved in cell wall biosynthesis
MKHLHSYGVVIPSCGRTEFLEQALDSVFAQTVQPAACVVVMDAEECLFECVSKQFGDRVKFVTSTARNANNARKQGALALMDASRIDAIAFLDDDDVWLPSKMEKQLKLVSDERLKSFVVGTRWASLKGDKVEHTFVPCVKDPQKESEVYQILGSFSTMVVSTDMLDHIEEGLAAYQDWHYLLTLVQMRTSVRRLEEDLVLYRFHRGGSITDDLVKRLDALKAVYLRLGCGMQLGARCWLRAQIGALEAARKPKGLGSVISLTGLLVAALAFGPLRLHKFRMATILAIETILGRTAVERYRTAIKSIMGRQAAS